MIGPRDIRKTLTLLAAVAALCLVSSATAQNDGSAVVLPLEAQTCDLPSAPPRIPEDADYDALVKAKKNVNDFQAAMVLYRGCLDNAKNADAITDGNQLALVEAHNYSVEMEERIAEQFNVAVRNFKAREADSKE
jgi:hypothetical protein